MIPDLTATDLRAVVVADSDVRECRAVSCSHLVQQGVDKAERVLVVVESVAVQQGQHSSEHGSRARGTARVSVNAKISADDTCQHSPIKRIQSTTNLNHEVVTVSGDIRERSVRRVEVIRAREVYDTRVQVATNRSLLIERHGQDV